MVVKACSGVSADVTASGALLATFCDEAEAELVMSTTYDWVTNYSTVSAVKKPVLASVVSAIGGQKIINYDMSGAALGEMQTRLDYLDNVIKRGIDVLKDKRVQDFRT